MQFWPENGIMERRNSFKCSSRINGRIMSKFIWKYNESKFEKDSKERGQNTDKEEIVLIRLR